MPTSFLARCAAALLPMCSSVAFAGVGYIAGDGGLVLQAQGDVAAMGEWQGQSPLQGFSGYGQVHWNGLCLTASHANQPLQWAGCRFGDRAQVWKLAARQLANELGYCAARAAPVSGALVLAQPCRDEPAQRWAALASVPAQSLAAAIADRAARARFLQAVATEPAGTVISLESGNPLDPLAAARTTARVLSVGGGDVIPLAGTR